MQRRLRLSPLLGIELDDDAARVAGVHYEGDAREEGLHEQEKADRITCDEQCQPDILEGLLTLVQLGAVLELALRAVREGERHLLLRSPLVEALAVHPLHRPRAAARCDERVIVRSISLEADAAHLVAGGSMGGVRGLAVRRVHHLIGGWVEADRRVRHGERAIHGRGQVRFCASYILFETRSSINPTGTDRTEGRGRCGSPDPVGWKGPTLGSEVVAE